MIFNYPKLEKNTSTDVVIIGGGISGALAAYHLTEAGIPCMVVDGRTIGLGSTAASTSILQYEVDVPLTRLVVVRGYQHATRAFILCNEAIEKLQTIADKIEIANFSKRKSLFFASAQRHISFLEAEYKLRKQAGFNVEFLHKADINDQFNFVAPAAILSHHGAQMDAYTFTHKLLQYSIKKGAEIYDRTFIKRVDSYSSGVHLRTKEGHSIRCKKLINASGYEVINFIGKKHVRLHSTFATISEHREKYEGWPDDVLFWNTADPYLYMTSLDNRIMVGGRDENFYSPGKRDKLIKTKSRQLARDFNKLFPEIPFQSEFSWTGTFGTTSDGLPYIGTLAQEKNIYYALGFGGNGITFSQVAAEIITGLLCGKKNSDAIIFSFDRH